MVIGEFVDCFPPELDGVGRVVKSYCEELTRRGHECYYIAPESPATPEAVDRYAFKTMLFNGVRVPGEPYRFGTPILDPSFLWREHNTGFDVLHAHSPFSAGGDARRVALFKKLPLIATFHSKYYDDFYQKTHSQTISKLCTRYVVDFYNHCDEVWAVNEKTADVLREYGYKGDIVIMPNGTNPYIPAEASVDAVRRDYGLAPEKTTLLFVGQMSWKKNIRRSLEAVALFAKTRPVTMLLAGQGPDEDEIRDCVRDLGLTDKVIFTGHIADRERMMSIFACADLLIFPSLYDNAPMVVREAAAVGTPAVLLRGSCSAEGVEDGVNGFLCDDTSQSVAERIAQALPLAGEVGARARDTIPMKWSGIIDRVLERYAALIEKKKAANE